MGSTYGGLLARSGHDVTFVDAWQERVAEINRNGIYLDGVAGELRIPARAVADAPAGLGADLAMIWTDANNTRLAAQTAVAALAPTGFAVTLQNGIGNVETLVEVLGTARVAAGSSMCSAAMHGVGHASFTHRAMTSVGELDGSASPRIEVLRAALTALCATTGLRLGEIARLPAMDRLQDRVIDEVLAVTAAKGLTLTDPDFRNSIKQHCWNKFSRPSMLQHIEAGKRTEIDALNARLIEEGRLLGVPTPYNEAVACLLKGVEHKRREAAGRTEADYAVLEANVTPRPAHAL